MTILNSQWPTLLDHAKALDPDGSVAAVVEILNQVNEWYDDAVWAEGNLTTGNRTTIRTGLPSGTWRKLYGGVQPTKSTREQVTDSCGMLEAYNEVDKALADLANNTNEFRLSEATAQIEGMAQQISDTCFYGNVGTNPERFHGFAPRYNSLSAPNAKNIIDALGFGSDNRSIWLIGWGMQTAFMTYPKGSKAGLQVNDKGQVTVENIDGNGGRMEGYRTHFRQDAGLVLKDWRYVVRIANIDYSDLKPDAATGANLPRLMFQALNRIPSLSMCKPVFYMSRDMRTTLGQQTAEGTKASTLVTENVGGKFTTSFQGVPVKRVDRLSVDEARVV